MRTTLAHLHLVFRSSLYGIWVGIMPGLGSSVSVWMSYAYAVRHVKSDIPYGEGAIAGVIAPETANNSKEGGAMVPTLFFGIPGSSSMAIMLGAFMVIGQPVGPQLLTTDIDVSFILAAAILLANLIAIPMFFMAVPGIVRLAALRREHIVPFVIALSLFGALYQDLHWITLAQFALGGVFGIALKWAGWSRAPFLLGFVMGPLAEISYIQTSQIWGWAMFARPGTIVMVVLFAYFASGPCDRSGKAATAGLAAPSPGHALAARLRLGTTSSPSPAPGRVAGAEDHLSHRCRPCNSGRGKGADRAEPAATGGTWRIRQSHRHRYLSRRGSVDRPTIVVGALYRCADDASQDRRVHGRGLRDCAWRSSQLLLFSLIVDVSYEPLIAGQLFHGLF